MRDIQHFFVAATCRYLNDLRNRQKGRIVLSIENIQKKNDLLYLYIRETVYASRKFENRNPWRRNPTRLSLCSLR